MQHAPSEVFHYTDTRGHSDAILLSKSCTILHAAKKDLLGLLQLQVRTQEKTRWTLCQHLSPDGTSSGRPGSGPGNGLEGGA